MKFIIMNGAGNRFGIFDARQRPGFEMSPELAKTTGVKGGPMGKLGADQIIIMRSPKVRGDVFMEIWNADGSKADNGTDNRMGSGYRPACVRGD